MKIIPGMLLHDTENDWISYILYSCKEGTLCELEYYVCDDLLKVKVRRGYFYNNAPYRYRSIILMPGILYSNMNGYWISFILSDSAEVYYEYGGHHLFAILDDVTFTRFDAILISE